MLKNPQCTICSNDIKLSDLKSFKGWFKEIFQCANCKSQLKPKVSITLVQLIGTVALGSLTVTLASKLDVPLEEKLLYGIIYFVVLFCISYFLIQLVWFRMKFNEIKDV